MSMPEGGPPGGSGHGRSVLNRFSFWLCAARDRNEGSPTAVKRTKCRPKVDFSTLFQVAQPPEFPV
jgi:hypothetical protein